MRLTLPKILWFVASVGIAWGVNTWRHDAAAHGLNDARAGDRDAAERWVDRALRESECELHEAKDYVSSSNTRQYVRRPDYVEAFVIGCRVLFEREELDRWLAKQKVGPFKQTSAPGSASSSSASQGGSSAEAQAALTRLKQKKRPQQSTHEK